MGVVDDPLLDLGYLHSKKLAHQVRVSARDNDIILTFLPRELALVRWVSGYVL
jgi:NurA-like 5'-3' nuclease